MIVWVSCSRLYWVRGTGREICRLVSARFQWPSHSLESRLRESTTAESRHGRLGGGSLLRFSQWSVARRRNPPFAIDRGTPLLLRTSQALHGPGRVALPRVHSVESVFYDSHRPSNGEIGCRRLAGANFGRHSLRCPCKSLL